jgi:hypothetical protein
MDQFITVKTFTYPHELSVLRSRLESEGIECFVKDELSSQVISLYSNTIGGAKLQVRESDLDKTIEILKEAGYLNDKDYQSLKNYNKENTYTDVPQKHWVMEYKGLIIVALIIAIIFMGYFLVLNWGE